MGWNDSALFREIWSSVHFHLDPENAVGLACDLIKAFRSRDFDVEREIQDMPYIEEALRELDGESGSGRV